LKSRNRQQWILIAMYLLAQSTTCRADVPQEQVPEVAHLLSFVSASDCRLIRNGRESSNAAAVKHIQRKYRYFRDAITDTESFIELAASRSTSSGEDYRVACPGKSAENSGDWLMRELKRFRSASGRPD
jgi:hypothetical protein